jgi:predicted nucleic acid-binding protein
MPVNVIDASAIIAYLEQENGADDVEGFLTDSANENIAHVITIGEVYTFYLKSTTESDADAAISLIHDDCLITPRRDTDDAFWKSVAKIRARLQTTIKNPATGGYHRISLADCFVIALAVRTGGTVITSDHDHFEPMRDMGICQVAFFRPRK